MKTACLLLLAAGAAHAAPAATVKVNQLGFAPAAHKLALAPAGAADGFEVVDAASGKTALRAALGAPAVWEPSKETVRLADFSSLTRPGRYRIRIAGLPLSDSFAIGPAPNRELNAAALKAYYFNRAGTALGAGHAGVYARAAGHPDDKVLVHSSAASAARPEGTLIASSKGWYDAGDYNKYIVNSGISSYTLLAAFEHFPAYFGRQRLNIPESANALPDILDESLWNLEWMLSMQDPNDGGVYHKLTNKRFEGMVMPEQASGEPRYVVKKSTAAALDFAATMATASRVFKPYGRQLPGLSSRMLDAAERAWRWAEANPAQYFVNPPDVATGEYGDKNVDDERAWAAAELYISSGKDSYYTALKPASVDATVPTWSDVRSLAWMSLAHHRARLTPIADQALIAARIDSLAAVLAEQWKGSPYRISMADAQFVWGSNAVVLNQSMMLLQGYRMNRKRAYLDAAQSGLDYVLGRNATGHSFVTGFGARPPLHPHHRPSQADTVEAPVPGFLAGGPQPRQQDKADCPVPYPSALAGLSYLDHVCSYASNEVAINWNAPLVYVTAAIDELTKAEPMEKPDDMLALIARQEQTLQFDSFDNRTALALGLTLVELARADRLPVTIDITRDGQVLFHHALDGAANDQANWIRRKSNLVKLTGHSSFYTHTEVKSQGGDIDAIPTLDPIDYAAHGGAFPLTVKGVGMVGTITVSGLPGADDHALVVRALASHLKRDVAL